MDQFTTLKQSLRKLPADFYIRKATAVAKDLLGKIIVHQAGKVFYSGMITEVEAYRQNDEASHSYRGISKRNRVMFQEGGVIYVYLIYGMYDCMNVVTGCEGTGEAVLIRSIEPVTGIKQMAANRGLKNLSMDSALRGLTDGPGKVCQAMKVNRKHNGLNLMGEKIFIAESGLFSGRMKIGRSERIGIRKGTHLEWRYFIRDNQFVSKHK
ncbi:MAG: DNA-3-methyladenine glycosylase [Ignavibacteriaceae bacterium]|nr:DNA-3-methyladenine glycosylase [Ignavibacteriaceae bacterium]